MVLAEMLNERFEQTVSIARRILDLGTDLTERLAFPSHFTRGEMLDRVARHAGGLEVRPLVADRTAHRRESEPVGSALDRRLVEPGHVTLARTIAGGVAVAAKATILPVARSTPIRVRILNACRLIPD